MTRDEFENEQYRISFTAGMNQRYHQSRAQLWARMDRGFRIAVGLFSVAGASLAVVTATSDSIGWDAASILIAGLAAVVAIILNVLPFGDWERWHVDLFRRWTDLREEIDALLFELNGAPDEMLIGRLKQQDAKVHRICGLEPHPNEALLRKCYRDEDRSRRGSACEPVQSP